MVEINYEYSIRGIKNEAITKEKHLPGKRHILEIEEGEIQFFLNIIEDMHDKKLKVNYLDKILYPDNYLKSFITYLCAVELHELGHAFNYQIGCNHGKQKKEGMKSCPWCEEVQKIYYWMI